MLTDDQETAIEKMVYWWRKQRKAKPFVLSGYAGTGKTFLIKEFAKNHIHLSESEIAFCTPTGKAATVLIKSGILTAITIHRLIYRPEKIIEEKEINGQIKQIEKIIFVKNDTLKNEETKLVIVDEISMVSKEIFDDLLSFNIPILCCGDPAQLPPVGGDKTGLLQTPDALLTQIVRQKEGNTIIEIADKVRKGERIEFGDYGDIQVINKKALNEAKLMEIMESVDQVLCGKNSTRKYLNDLYRSKNKIFEKLPQVGEKIICIQNNWEVLLDSSYNYALVNGMIGTIKSDPIAISSYLARIDFRADFLKETSHDILIDTGIFNADDFYFERTTKIEGYGILEQINRFEFAYAISVHKSQGSQFESILIIDESRVFGADQDKWLYTAITRAEKKAIIVR